jgi:uncharacterized tellurite resistance protein B-like protein
MDTTLISSEAVELLSRITGKTLTQQAVSPSLVFQAALVSVLLGVILADKTVTDQEKQKLQVLLNQLASPGTDTRQLLQTLLKGVQQHQVYRKENELLALTASLSESERLLLISLGYQMSASDGDMDSREKAYLQMIASRLGVKIQYLAILEAEFSGQGVVEPEALNEVYSLLDPAKFQTLDPLFANAANSILANFPAQGKPQTNRTLENSSLELQQSATRLNELIQTCFDELHQTEAALNGKRKIIEVPTEDILEQLGDASGRFVKIRGLADKLKTQAVEEVNDSWQQWLEVLENNLKTKWSSEPETKAQTSEDQKKLAQDYAVQFAQELKTELDSWINQILKEQLEGINRDLGSIQQNLSLFSQKTDPSFGNQLIPEVEKINADFCKPIEHLSEHLGGNDDSRFELLGFAFDVTSSIVGAVSGGIAGVFKFGGSSAAQPSIRQKVFERGWEKFSQSKDKFLEKIKEIVVLIIDNRVETVTKIAEQAVSLYEELLGKQERYQQETAEQQEAEKAWILQQRQELEQMQKNIEAVLNQSGV